MSRYAPRMSQALKDHIWAQLSLGYTPKQIYDKHKAIWWERVNAGQSMIRDDFIRLQDIAYLDRKHKKGSWRLHTNPAISIRSWALQHPEDVFFFQDVGEMNGTQVPFTIGIQTPTQCESMLSYGHNGAISMDATFGTNDMKFHLFTLMGFDDHRTGVPLAWIITSRQTVQDLIEWLKPLKEKMLSHMPHWKPSCFLVDDAPQELKALRLVLYLVSTLCLFLKCFLISFIKFLITSNAFYVVLTPSTHGDFIAYVSLLGSYGVWTRFPSTFVVGMFSKHGAYVVLKKSKMWKCGVESSKTFMM
jgi:hypothetical protein